MASNFKIKIAARLRPRIEGEVDDGGIQVVREEGKVESSGTSSITVPNPRDDKQIFKFPYVFLFFFLFFFLPLFSYFILHSVFLVLFFLFYVWVVNGIELQSSFSSCYDHNSKQEEIFRNDVEPMLDVVYTGVVCCFVIYVRGVSFD